MNKYEKPTMEVVLFTNDDVLRTSNCEIVDCPDYSCSSDGSSVCTMDWNTCDTKDPDVP